MRSLPDVCGSSRVLISDGPCHGTTSEIVRLPRVPVVSSACIF